ncbi:microfibril-associated glycoprotein 4-like [Penaeus monodon]|uniref:microfibril-associated glycoprotein 4-like n=1 Tax=Penaeus monodon TaxID=6687 RepID=UPI0018A7DD5B|nr:microfibril-associated glycoprotein 4-like [Penaeus monodon]
MCQLFSSKVSRHWAGVAPAAVTFDACHTSWVTNPARLHPVSMSASSETVGSEAQKAVDGFLSSDMSHCFSSAVELGPWWLADLGETRRVSQVRVHTRQDGVSGDFASVEARLGDSATPASNPQFGQNAGSLHAGAEVDFAPSTPMSGRFLSLQSVGTGPGALTICDVEILAEGIQPKKMKNCLDQRRVGNQVDGMYAIYPYRCCPRATVSVYCDMSRDGGGWTVIQRRRDIQPHINFSLSWEDYKNGFGYRPSGEFWLGNSLIHALSSQSPNELRIDLSDFSGLTTWAKYSQFFTLGVEDNFQLNVSGYSGTAGDSMAYHSGNNFSTVDKDVDAASWNCAYYFPGGWWYAACLSANLNGPYLGADNTILGQGIIYKSWTGLYYSLNSSTMMIRPVN